MDKTVIVTPRRSERLTEELETLCRSIKLEPVKVFEINTDKLSSAWLTGSGKAEEIISWAVDEEADVIVFNMALSPSQQRNWEKASQLCVIDRQEVILEIFSQRANSREAALQTGLARMEYSLPRLTRAWTHLSRQRGGTRGNRGEGETQLEIDRRIVLKKIAKLKRDLAEVEKQRAIQRSKRSGNVPSACIVGYTNAGKSSLLNYLCNAEILAENKLFATLDSTTRLLKLPGGTELTLTDTVGFIRDLPHSLVQAFHSTLEEAVLADFLIIVVDVSDTDALQQYNTTISSLKEIKAETKKRLIVFNKTDKLDDEMLCDFEIREIQEKEETCIFCSVKTGNGIDQLISQIVKLLRDNRKETTFVFPVNEDNYKIVAQLHNNIEIIREKYTENKIIITAICTENIRMKYSKYICSNQLAKNFL